MSSPDLYKLEKVSREFHRREGLFTEGRSFSAVHEVTLSFQSGFFYGLVGGSGSGKTTLAKMMAGLLPLTSGEMFYEGERFRDALKSRNRPFFRRVQMIFQNPYHSLDSKWSIRRIVEEGLQTGTSREKLAVASEGLEKVGLKSSYLQRKPAELSGGERQRVAIARALAVKPEFLILDEPTSQLDMSVQASIMKLLADLKGEISGGMLFITHDLALVSRLADRLIVLSSGEVVEAGACRDVLLKPSHQVTRSLIEAIPKLKTSAG